MGKVKGKKKFSGVSVRDNPTAIVCENDFENEENTADLWQRIATQLQSGN